MEIKMDQVEGDAFFGSFGQVVAEVLDRPRPHNVYPDPVRPTVDARCEGLLDLHERELCKVGIVVKPVAAGVPAIGLVGVAPAEQLPRDDEEDLIALRAVALYLPQWLGDDNGAVVRLSCPLVPNPGQTGVADLAQNPYCVFPTLGIFLKEVGYLKELPLQGVDAAGPLGFKGLIFANDDVALR